MADRGASARAQRWSARRGRPECGGVREEPGEQSSVAARPREVGRPLPSAAGATGAHSEGRRAEDAAYRDTDLRRQGAAEGGGDGAGGRLRAGFLAVLVRLSARKE